MKTSEYKSRTLDGRPLHPETLMMGLGYAPALSEGALKPPIFLTSTFVFESAQQGKDFFDLTAGRRQPGPGEKPGLVYSRFNNPNFEILEDRLAVWDEAERSAVFASGMAAIATVMLTFLRPGDSILHSRPLYGGTETLIRKVLPEWGVGHESFVDGLAPAQLDAALETAAARGKVALVYVETPANPTNALVDFALVTRALAAFERRHGYRPVSACDNTMLGPIFQHPLRDGIDVAVYSLTKYVGGHSDLVAGGVSGSAELIKRLKATRGAFGAQLDPHSSWMIARSMETLVLRMRRAAATASRVAHWLAHNPVRQLEVLHPQLDASPAYQEVYRRQCTGAGSTFSIVLEGGREAAFRFINALALFKSAVSLGGTESLVCHPASTTHSGVAAELRAQVGVSEGLVRLSIGLEHEDDLIADLENALRRC